jgi:predicted ribosome quality control (RQC) complex YloA/Tae2 family protein
MHLHYLTLQRQTEFLRDIITGAKILDSYTQVKNEWVIALHSAGAERGFLQLSCDGQYPYIVFLEQRFRGKNSATVMEEIIGKKITEIRLLPGERIIEILFEDSEIILLLQFFTARTNFFLLDKDFCIFNAFKGQRKFVGDTFELPPGQERIDPAEISLNEQIQTICKYPEDTLIQTLRRFQYMTRPLVEEVLFRSGIAGETLIGDLQNGQIEGFARSLQTFIEECRSAAPRVYFRDNLPEKFSLAALHHLRDLESKEFGDINSALRFFCFQGHKQQSLRQKKVHFSEALNRKIKSLQYALKKLESRPADPDKEAFYLKIGQLIVSQPHLIKPGITNVELVDYFDPDMPAIAVKIDPQLTARENAQIYFDKAKQSGEQLRQHQRREEDLDAPLHLLAELKSELDAADSFKKMEQIEEKLKAHHVLSYQAEETEKYRRPYKTYTFKDYEIWVGRSGRDNDTMTFKHANKEDFWLHVQGYSGSHVIIRNPRRVEKIPADVLEYAGGLAVTYSAAKHASYVPVLYTRVKYVRKARKSPPGTVIPTQEKTIFVDPVEL